MEKIILVVDDDRSNLMLAQKVLNDEYRVAVVNSGELCFRYLEKNTPNLILLDILMPEMDGFQVMEKLKENEAYNKIPVIFLTADRNSETEEQCFEVGAMDYITKPFVPSIMRQRVKRTLELEDYSKHLEQLVEAQLGRITRLQNDIIITMANMVESRDGTTGQHIQRTSVFGKLLINEMKNQGVYAETLTPTYIDYFCKAAPMHDIGKIAVSDLILQKPGALTDEEYQKIKEHTVKGGQLIRENMGCMEDPEFVQIASDIATYHHEKWSGGGYPEGLCGEAIPICARILAIVDVFDALVAKRQYKEGMSVDQAFAIIEKDKANYDPSIYEVFMSMKDEFAKKIAEG